MGAAHRLRAQDDPQLRCGGRAQRRLLERSSESRLRHVPAIRMQSESIQCRQMTQNGKNDCCARREAERMRGGRAILRLLEEGRPLETYLGAYLNNETKSRKPGFPDEITTL